MARRNGDEAAAERRSSHLVSFDSEIYSGSPDPLSFPSQPPDVSNWFSSYKYESPESPVLPHDLGGSLLPEEDESETQVPLAHAGAWKSEDPPLPMPEDKHSARSVGVMPNGWNSISRENPECRSSSRACSVMLKENQNLELEFKGKSYGKYDDGDADCYLSSPNRTSVEGCTQSPTRLSAQIKCEEQCSDLKDPRNGLELLISNFDLKVVHEFPLEKSLPNCNVEKDGFVSTRSKDYMSSPSKFISSVKYEDMAANEENPKDKFGVQLDGKRHLSRWKDHNDSSDCKPTSFPGTDILRFKRKRSLREVFGEEFIAKDYEEDECNVLMKRVTNLFDDHACTQYVHPKMSKFEEELDGKILKRVDDIKSKVKDEFSHDKQTILRCNNEESSENVVTNDFISTNNKENSIGNSTILPPRSNSAMNNNNRAGAYGVLGNKQLMSGVSSLQESNKSMAYKEQSQAETRSALADKTNLQGGLAAAVMEIPGKWQCPRKSKPYMGPQLKQLRLEHWVRRVN